MARFVVIHGRHGRWIEEHEVRVTASALTGTVEIVRPRPDLVVLLDRDASWERMVPGDRSGDTVGTALLISSAADHPGVMPGAEELTAAHPERAIGALPSSFVVIAWNGERCRLFTDSVGSRAIWSAQRPGQVVFASEPHLVLAHPDVPKSPDLGVVAERLSYRPSTGHTTVFDGVTLTPAGSMVEVGRAGDASEDSWHSWNVEVDRQRSVDDWAEEIFATSQRVVEREVRQRGSARSVVHVSGGLDSSALAGVIADKGLDAQMVALTRCYPGLPCDESTFQDAALRGSTFDRRSTAPLSVDLELDLLAPTAASRLPLLRIEPAERCDSAWAASLGRRSELTGVGGDELFDAINRTPLESAIDGRLSDAVDGLRGSSPRMLLREHREFLPMGFRRSRQKLRPWITPDLAENAALAKRLAGERTPILPSKRTGQRLEWASGGAWRSIRAESTERHRANSGTEFVPLFLDPELVALAVRIPNDLRVSPDDARRLQRLAFSSVLPPELLARRGKVHFDARHAIDLLSPAIESIATDLSLARSGLVDQAAFDDSYRSFATVARRNIAEIPAMAGPLWAVIGCELWWRQEFA